MEPADRPARCLFNRYCHLATDVASLSAEVVDGWLGEPDGLGQLLLATDNFHGAPNMIMKAVHRLLIGYPIGIVKRFFIGMPIEPSSYPMDMDLADNLIAALRAKGISGAELARRSGVSQPTINDLINRNQKSTKFLPEIAEALGISPADLDPRLALPRADDGYRPPPTFIGERDLPVFASVEGGPGELVINTDPIDRVPRPWYMGQVRDGYAVVVVGESMVPAFEPGDMAIVNPRLAPMRNKHHIIVQESENGEFRATIKRILGWTSSDWQLEQYNPPPGRERRFSLPRDIWNRALRVVGKWEGN